MQGTYGSLKLEFFSLFVIGTFRNVAIRGVTVITWLKY